MKINKMVWIIGILIIGIVLVGKKEAILSSGEYNVDADCTWATNLDPMTLRCTSFNNAGVWITLDKDGDGIWEKYGRKSSGTSSQIWSLVIEDYNIEGDDITSPSPTHTDLFVDCANNQNYVKLELDYGASSNAIIPDCVRVCNTDADVDCDNNVCDSELILYMSGWRVGHRTANCDSITGCVSDNKLLIAMAEWKNTHKEC